MGTKNNPGQYDCYANAEPDEPMFVLLGRDRHAPTLVWLWATLRELDQEKPEMVQEARDCALAMIEWQKNHGRKAVGLAQATLAGQLEMVRTINGLVNALKANPGNAATDMDIARTFFAACKFEGIA